MSDSGSHVLAIQIKYDNEKNNVVPFFMMKELIDGGFVWREGEEKIAEVLRNKLDNGSDLSII